MADSLLQIYVNFPHLVICGLEAQVKAIRNKQKYLYIKILRSIEHFLKCDNPKIFTNSVIFVTDRDFILVFIKS